MKVICTICDNAVDEKHAISMSWNEYHRFMAANDKNHCGWHMEKEGWNCKSTQMCQKCYSRIKFLSKNKTEKILELYSRLVDLRLKIIDDYAKKGSSHIPYKIEMDLMEDQLTKMGNLI